MLNGNLACLQANINELLADAGMANLVDLRNALTELQSELTALQSHLGITDTLARVNQAIGDVQRVLALGGMCPIPLRAPRIPNVLNDILRGYFGAGRSILSDLGRLGKPQLCINGAGGVNTGSYNPDSIIGSLQRKLGNLNSIPQRQIDNYVRRINGVKNAIRSQIDRELFPDFRHKHNLLTGRPKVPGEPAVTIADVNRAHTQALQINSGLRQTGSYPIKSKGIAYQNAWAPVLGPSVYALAVNTLTPADPTLIRQVPVYDYCGRLVGYQEDVVAGDREAEGGDPQVDAEIVPLPLNHTMLWIDGTIEDPTRVGWAEEGNTSLQLVGAAGNQRQVEALNLNPEITIYRGRSHLFVLPPSSEQEFYIYETKVEGGQRVPDTAKRFSKGLSRFESGEMLDEANGRNEDNIDWIDLSLPPEERNTGPEPAAWKRKELYPDGMTLMINVGGQIDNLYNSGISHSSGASGFDAQGKKTGIVSLTLSADAPDALFYVGGAAGLAQGNIAIEDAPSGTPPGFIRNFDVIETAQNYSIDGATNPTLTLYRNRTYTFTLTNLASLSFFITDTEELENNSNMIEEEWPDYLAYSNEDGSRFGLLKLA